MTDPRQPAYDAVFAYIRQQPRDFLPTTVVGRNAMIWRAVHAALDAMGVPGPEGEQPAPAATEPHIYLSTGCYHGDHAYCQAMTGLNGAKRPASCKKCRARCICPCHQQTEPPVHIGGGANAEDCPACRPEIDKTVLYPWTCPGPDEAAADDLTGVWTPDPPIGCLNLGQPKEQ